MTHEILLRIAARLEASHPAEAIKLQFVASEVQHLERIVNELVSESIELMEPRKRQHRRKPHLVTPATETAA
ncbi:MAG TPA: hypothetical protein VGI78_09505 [Acetobacteraceae bacterium]|jgi:hypothetical protein